MTTARAKALLLHVLDSVIDWLGSVLRESPLLGERYGFIEPAERLRNTPP